jgi:hypothetical protein
MGKEDTGGLIPENEDNREAHILNLQIGCSYHVAHTDELDVLEVLFPNYRSFSF